MRACFCAWQTWALASTHGRENTQHVAGAASPLAFVVAPLVLANRRFWDLRASCCCPCRQCSSQRRTHSDTRYDSPLAPRQYPGGLMLPGSYCPSTFLSSFYIVLRLVLLLCLIFQIQR